MTVATIVTNGLFSKKGSSDDPDLDAVTGLVLNGVLNPKFIPRLFPPSTPGAGAFPMEGGLADPFGTGATIVYARVPDQRYSIRFSARGKIVRATLDVPIKSVLYRDLNIKSRISKSPKLKFKIGRRTVADEPVYKGKEVPRI